MPPTLLHLPLLSPPLFPPFFPRISEKFPVSSDPHPPPLEKGEKQKKYPRSQPSFGVQLQPIPPATHLSTTVWCAEIRYDLSGSATPNPPKVQSSSEVTNKCYDGVYLLEPLEPEIISGHLKWLKSDSGGSTPKWPKSDSKVTKVTQKWLKSSSKVTFESLLGHFGVDPRSHFRVTSGVPKLFRVQGALAGKPHHKTSDFFGVSPKLQTKVLP